MDRTNDPGHTADFSISFGIALNVIAVISHLLGDCVIKFIVSVEGDLKVAVGILTLVILGETLLLE